MTHVSFKQWSEQPSPLHLVMHKVFFYILSFVGFSDKNFIVKTAVFNVHMTINILNLIWLSCAHQENILLLHVIIILQGFHCQTPQSYTGDKLAFTGPIGPARSCEGAAVIVRRRQVGSPHHVSVH